MRARVFVCARVCAIAYMLLLVYARFYLLTVKSIGHECIGHVLVLLTWSGSKSGMLMRCDVEMRCECISMFNG